MDFSIRIGVWDVVLVLAVSAQVTAIAYLRAPKWKAMVLSLPIPFTVGSLALGRHVDVTHVAGLLLFLAFTHAVRLLHQRTRMGIAPAIAVSALGHCTVGACLAQTLPRTDAAFWTAVVLALVVSVALHLTTAHREERGHRTPLPLWRKLPIVAVVVLIIVLLKDVLHGFMPTFPMVGLFTVYEARHSLWTICRQVPAFLMAFVPMMVTVALTQSSVGLGLGLALGSGVFLCLMLPLMWFMWFARQSKSKQPEDAG